LYYCKIYCITFKNISTPDHVYVATALYIKPRHIPRQKSDFYY